MQTVSSADSKILTIKDIPSKFVPYPNLPDLRFKALTVGQLKAINSNNLPDDELIKIYNEACLNFDIMDLSFQDLLFCSAYLALFTDPAQSWAMPVDCGLCGHKFTHRINSRNFLEFHDMKDTRLPMYVTINKEELELNIFTVRNWLDYYGKEYDKHDQEFLTYAFLIKNKSVEDAYTLINNITDLRDVDVLKRVEERLFHGVKDPKIKCPECNQKFEYPVELEVSTLKPFCESEESIDDRIVFESRNQS